MQTALQNDNIDAFIRALPVGGDRVLLDLQHIKRVERPAASILSAALLGALGDRPLDVRLPESQELQRRMSASALAFALANRPGRTHFIGDELDLSQWKRSWSPGSRSQIDRMFKNVEIFRPDELGESEDEPSLYDRYHAAFVNLHRAAPARGSTDVTNVVRPWLSRVLPHYMSSRGEPQRSFIHDMGVVIDELLENVREHATQHVDERHTRSLVQVAVTKGGGVKSSDRLYLSVLDTGPGIAATARHKLDGDRAAILQDGEIVKALFAGKLAGWGRGRGLGLPRVWKCAEAWKGARIQVATNAERLSREGGDVRRAGGFDIHGTVIVFMVPLPPKLVS